MWQITIIEIVTNKFSVLTEEALMEIEGGFIRLMTAGVIVAENYF
ncbi:bacteriocin [Streptococcus thoraltensis]